MKMSKQDELNFGYISQQDGKENLKIITQLNNLKENNKIKSFSIVALLILTGIICFKLQTEIGQVDNVITQISQGKEHINSQNKIDNSRKNLKRVLNIEQQDEIVTQENNKEQANKEEEISKVWEYFYILRQYLFILLLWVMVKFFDHGLIKKENKYYLDINFIMFTEGVAFGFFCGFLLFSFVGFLLTFVLNYDLKESVQFSQSITSLTSTLILYVFSLLLIGKFALTPKQNRTALDKIVLTLAMLPSIFLVVVLPAQGMIILMT